VEDIDAYMKELKEDKTYAEAFGIPLLRYRELKRRVKSDDELDALIADELNTKEIQ